MISKNKFLKVAYIDSIEAYDNISNKKYSMIFTDIPELSYFLKKEKIINIDNFIDKDKNYFLGSKSLEIADDIDNSISDILKLSGLSYIEDLKLARPIGVIVSSLLYRSSIFSKFFREKEIDSVDLYINEEWSSNNNSFMEVNRFSSPYSELCKLGFLDQSIKYKIIHSKSEIIEEKVDSALESTFIRALMYPLSVNFLKICENIKFLNYFLIRGSIPVIGRPDGIIRETLPWLTFMGYNFKIFPKVLPGVIKEYKILNKKKTKSYIIKNNLNVLNILKKEKYKLQSYFSNNELIVIATIIEKVIKEDLEKLPLWINATNRYAKKIFELDKTNKIVMASALSSPICKIFHNIIKENKYEIVLYEHGVSKGLTKLSYKRPHLSEINHSDYFVSFSEVVNKLFKNMSKNKNYFNISAPPIHNKKVLHKNIQRILWRKKFNLKNKDIALIHVSPFPYSGNRRLGLG